MKPDGTQEIWTVSSLNREAKALLERGLGTIWLEAEVSNLARPASGHLYFTLKDRNAQVRAAFFRQRQRGSSIDFDNGDQVLVRAKLSLYEPRGDYQLIVEHIEPAGEGALRRQFEQLKAKLAAEGLFSDSRKQPLPSMPGAIGLITSASGAALRDILHVLARRMPSVPVIVYAASVQGDEAPATLRRALHQAVYRHEVDVLIISRGGGAIEDLAAFNDEALARAVSDCPIPVISGVGHETDFTIVDFVADARAPTPSAAAELSVPDRAELIERIAKQRRALLRAMRYRLQQRSQANDRLTRRLALQSPAARLARQRERLATLQRGLRRAGLARLSHQRLRLSHLSRRLSSQRPQDRVIAYQRTLSFLCKRLIRSHKSLLKDRQRSLAALADHLHAVSPLATLGRGYAIVTRAASSAAVTDAATLAPGDALRIRLQHGAFDAAVQRVEASGGDE